MKKPILVIIYNHSYPENILKIEQIYNKRFSYIYHLIPFYTADGSLTASVAKRIIPVFDSSLYFQSFFAQGLSSYYHDDASHYIFIADDLLLNPSIDEVNYRDFFKLSADKLFISNFIPIIDNPFNTLDRKKLINIYRFMFDGFYNNQGWQAELVYYYCHRIFEAYNFILDPPGLELERHLPSLEVAKAKFSNLGLTTSIKNDRYRLSRNKRILFFLQILVYRLFYKFSENSRMVEKLYNKCIQPLFFRAPVKRLSYPLAFGYSDIVIVPQGTIREFCCYCGAFAAANLFAEIAIPTAVILSATKKDHIISYY